MKPKKKILLVCGDELGNSLLAFNMKIWGYAVTSVQTERQAAPVLNREAFDLVLMVPGFDCGTHNRFMKSAGEMQDIQLKRFSSLRIYDPMKVLPDGEPKGLLLIPRGETSISILRDRNRVALDIEKASQEDAR